MLAKRHHQTRCGCRHCYWVQHLAPWSAWHKTEHNVAPWWLWPIVTYAARWILVPGQRPGKLYSSLTSRGWRRRVFGQWRFCSRKWPLSPQVLCGGECSKYREELQHLNSQSKLNVQYCDIFERTWNIVNFPLVFSFKLFFCFVLLLLLKFFNFLIRVLQMVGWNLKIRCEINLVRLIFFNRIELSKNDQCAYHIIWWVLFHKTFVSVI